MLEEGFQKDLIHTLSLTILLQLVLLVTQQAKSYETNHVKANLWSGTSYS